MQGLLGCETCHSAKDWTQHGAPNQAGIELAGQSLPIPGFPGTIVAPNLTPDPETGSGRWTDDQIASAFREGIKHDGGTTLFPMTPYGQYKSVSDEDVASVIVYLRSLTAVRSALPASHINFPGELPGSLGLPSPFSKPCPAPIRMRRRVGNIWSSLAAGVTVLSTT